MGDASINFVYLILFFGHHFFMFNGLKLLILLKLLEFFFFPMHLVRKTRIRISVVDEYVSLFTLLIETLLNNHNKQVHLACKLVSLAADVLNYS